MIADLKSYPAMKDSGVPWLGEIPAHWTVAPNRAMLRRRKILVGARHAEYRLLSLTKQGVIVRDVERLRGKFSADMGTSQVVKAGDLIFCLFDIPETPRTVGLSHHEGMITSAYTVFECADATLAAYLNLYYQAMDDRKLLSPLYSGLRNTIPPTRFLGTKSPVPPPDEQAAIVRFLDHADRRIRWAIRAKQKLIKLLEEQKQAIIHRAVTRGLDPDVRLKPSGVEWLGDVPERWEVVRLGRLVELLTGFPFKSEGFTQDERGVKLLRGINISPGRLRWTDVVRWPRFDHENYGAFELQVGDIVLGMDRPIIQGGTRVASVGKSDLPAFLLQRVARIRPKKELRAEFLTLLLAGKSFAGYLSPIFTGISVPHLSPEQIKSFLFALPTDAEQMEIERWTATETRNICVAASGATREISLLREYRTRLIADVVTGKLDVREAAAWWPDEPDAPEVLEDAGNVSTDAEEEAVDVSRGAVDEEAIDAEMTGA